LKASWAFLAFLISLAACRQDMHDQPKLELLEKHSFFADSRSVRPQVPGTVARGQLYQDRHLYAGLSERKQPELALFPVSEEELERALERIAGPPLAETFPFPITREHLARGRERFEIFCSPCHGLFGAGDGIVVHRGFRRPPSYHIDRLRRAPAGHFFDVMTRGIGAMGDFADRIPSGDRWAITAYIRALQLSQAAPLTEIPAALPPLTPQPEVPSIPRLQTDPIADYERLRSAQQARLHSYGWVDPERKIRHIPIDRAIDLLLEKGLPVR
jgi:hypothetical protein